MERALRKLRRAMVRPDRDRLSGLIEVDEILIGGKRPTLEGRSPAGKTLVLAAVEDKHENGIGRIRLLVIPDAAADMIEKNLARIIEPESMVRTDGWRGYQRLSSLGYRHIVVKRHEIDHGFDTTPLVHRVSALLKR